MPKVNSEVNVRLCLNSGGLLINIFEQNNKLEFMLERTIEDLIDVKVVADTNYPWLVCSNCTEKLTEFRLFKRRCAECLFVFYNRIYKGCNPTTKDSITNREEEESDVTSHGNKGVERPGEESVEGTSGKVWACSSPVERATVEMEDTYSAGSRVNWMADNDWNGVEIQCPGGIKKDLGDATIASDAIDNRAVDVRDDMIVVKKEVYTALRGFAAPEKDINRSIVPLTQEGDCHWSDIEVSGNLDHSEDRELRLTFNEEVDIKEESDIDIPREEGDMAGDILQDDGQVEDGVVKLLHTCQICTKVFAKRSYLKAHVMRVHLVKKRKLKCGVCSEAFECISDLDGHLESVHAVEKRHRCQQCSRYFQNPSELRIHMSTHTGKSQLKCDICSKGFRYNGLLKRHMLKHTLERPHKCNICSKNFKVKLHLDSHMLTHRVKEQYRCEKCLKVFSRKRDVSKHILLRTCKRVHKCAVCLKTFAKNANLNRHMFTHTNERLQKCELCSKAFNHKAYLEIHMLTHTGERPHKCEICLKGFHQKPHLKEHMLTHTGERPHKCEICSKSFALKQTLKGHMRVHAGVKSHKCAICSRAFSHKSNLRRHMLTHTNERPYKCGMCSKTFKHTCDLMRHKKGHTEVITD
ncbi:zinc finger protein 431-like [Hetaerina americana]|uniref:zinc finger protein 431-like n=1 Tax=Hetaerina americana TaxID=62018 RepID=UPI003A7F2849